MPPKNKRTGLTPQMEDFAQCLSTGMSQADAYRRAYPGSLKWKDSQVYSKASTLAGHVKVMERVKELRAPVVAKVQYDIEAAMREAAEAFEVAKVKENGGAMVAAVTLRAKLNGLLVDKKQIVPSDIEDLTDEQLDRLIARKMQEAGVTLQ